ncbi:MAG TPA: hypothetical protein VFG65_04430 [Fimbriimonadales bacterium]|nr:hypothetical protein [Fimbriimonadales bacterium]
MLAIARNLAKGLWATALWLHRRPQIRRTRLWLLGALPPICAHWVKRGDRFARKWGRRAFTVAAAIFLLALVALLALAAAKWIALQRALLTP